MESIKKLEITEEYPATLLVHWVTGPVACCEFHAQQLVNIGNTLGSHIAVTPNYNPNDVCENCINENKNK